MQTPEVFTPAEAGARFLGWADKTSRNKLTAGTYPFPVRLVAGKKVVLLSDVEAILTAAPVVAGAPLPSISCLGEGVKVRRGPPTAAERGRALTKGISIKELRLLEAGEVQP